MKTYAISYGHRLACLDLEVKARSNDEAITKGRVLLNSLTAQSADWQVHSVREV